MLDAVEADLLNYISQSISQSELKKVQRPLSRQAFGCIMRDCRNVLAGIQEASGAANVALDIVSSNKGLLITGNEVALLAAEAAIVKMEASIAAAPRAPASDQLVRPQSSDRPPPVALSVDAPSCPICM